MSPLEKESLSAMVAILFDMKSALAKKYSLDYLDNYQKSIIFAAQIMSNLKSDMLSLFGSQCRMVLKGMQSLRKSSLA